MIQVKLANEIRSAKTGERLGIEGGGNRRATAVREQGR